jgi:hypothetical protein
VTSGQAAAQNGSVIDEAQLRRMTQTERHELARMLAAIDVPHPMADQHLRLRRRFGLLFMTACCVVLACWIGILILTLPDRFTSSDWRAVWVGLDIAELIGLAAIGWAAWRQRQVLIFCMLMTGTLLLCDAWFDMTLSYGSSDFTTSVVTAVLAEFPLAFLLFVGAWRLVRATVKTVMQLAGNVGPVPPLWRVPLLAGGLDEALPAPLRQQAGDLEATGVTGGDRSSS